MRKLLEQASAPNRLKGVITVFFTLLSVLFLGLIFMLVESVRISGAKAQAENIVDMANYSIFGEYEKKLLEKYEIFAVDGSYGSDDFSKEKVSDRMQTYLELNANPHGEGVSALCFDPWNIEPTQCQITEYALLTDDKGENFYQQAVAYVHETALAGAAGELYQYYTDAGSMKKLEDQYKTDKDNSDKNMESVSAQEEQRRQELAAQEEETGTSLIPAVLPENPLPSLAAVIRRGVLRNVCGNAAISDKSISKGDLPSMRRHKSGTMKLKQPYGGLTDDLLFREYLLSVFPNYLDTDTVGKLQYQLEYIVAGKRSDQMNLKAVAARLLLLREGANYAFCANDFSMRSMSASLAGLLLGWTGIPALVEVLDQALLLGWSYGESLMDVRTLFNGGRVPLTKDAGSWCVTLDRLGHLGELLDMGGRTQQNGLNYKEYLRILLNLQFVSDQKSRALDMLELSIREEEGLSSFRADHCIVGIKDEVTWNIPVLFSKVTGAFMPVRSKSFTSTVKGSFAYD